tara:strand:- start:397 stop:669 length:273 start_codon:yes stop_codon:yes gene_type:complete
MATAGATTGATTAGAEAAGAGAAGAGGVGAFALAFGFGFGAAAAGAATGCVGFGDAIFFAFFVGLASLVLAAGPVAGRFARGAGTMPDWS